MSHLLKMNMSGDSRYILNIRVAVGMHSVTHMMIVICPQAISGRLHVKDQLLNFEYFSSTFGSILPEDAILVTSDPLNACGPINVEVSAGAAILVSRGGCSFGEKVVRVQVLQKMIPRF